MNKQIANYFGPILELDHEQTLKNPNFHLMRLSNFIGLPSNKKALSFITNYKK
jgi:hypothetical protein